MIDGFSSFRWRRRFFDPGEFELHCAATPDNLALLTGENVIHRMDRREAGIIEGVRIGTPNSGAGDEIVATGRMGSAMLDRRIITPAIRFSGTAEDAMRRIVSDNAVAARSLPHLILGAAGGFSQTCSFQAEHKTLLAVCEALGKAAPLGFRVRLDAAGKRWVFEVYDGTDHSVVQTAHPVVLFSDEFQNISGAAYAMDNTGYSNYAIVGGEDRVTAEVDRTGGEPRRELWVDAGDLQKGSLSDDDYKAQLTQRGLEKLAGAAKSESFSANAVDTGNFAYRTDWDLGDIVSFEKWGILLNQRITEVEEVYENGVETITPVCGTPLPETLNLGDDR